MATTVTGGTIYKIENTVNGKVYIGQTGNWKLREIQHRSDLKRGRHGNCHLQRAFNKYGKQAFTFTVLVDNLPEKYLDDMERGFIATFRTMNPEYGYNKESGGCANKKASEETKEKLRQASLKMSEETRRKMSEAKLAYFANGGIHPKQGTKQSPESIEKIRQKKLGKPSPKKGIKCSPETIERIKEALLISNAKPVYSHSEDITYPSLTAAAAAHGLLKASLSKAIRRKHPIFGMRFSYLV
jgi:group I intron endonuclease